MTRPARKPPNVVGTLKPPQRPSRRVAPTGEFTVHQPTATGRAIQGEPADPLPGRRPAGARRGLWIRAWLVVAVAYGSSAYALARAPMVHSSGRLSDLAVMAPVALVLTFTHAFFPAWLLGKGARNDPDNGVGLRAFAGFWYGMPLLFIGLVTQGALLLGATLHILVARRGTRMWTFVQYGCTALGLFTLASVLSSFPWPYAIPLVLAQAGLLALIDHVARRYWVADPLPADPLRDRILALAGQ